MEALDQETGDAGKAQHSWVDITELCRAAAGLLTYQTPMINIPSFSLYDSMSAVELMEPKMDHLMNLTRPLDVNELFHISIPKTITESVLLHLFQTLMNQEIAFLDGCSIVESTHSCVLLWEESWPYLSEGTEPLVDLMLQYAKNMHTSMGHISRAIITADIYEEEDFQPASNPSLNVELEVAGIIVDALFPPPLQLLVQFRSEMHRCALLVDSWIQFGMRTDLHHRSTENDAAMLRFCEEARESFCKLKSVAESVQQLVADGQLVGASKSHADFDDIGFLYNDLLVKRLQLNPARTVSMREFGESIKYLKNVCDEALAIIDIAQMIGRRNNLHFEELLSVCIDISQKEYHVLVRSLYVSVIRYFSADMSSLLIRSLEHRRFPESLLAFPLLVDKWMPGLVKVCWESCKSLLFHRNKLLVRLEAVLLTWSTICNDALLVDHEYKMSVNLGAGKAAKTDKKARDQMEAVPWFRYWTLCTVTQIIDQFFGLMMEAEIVAVSELDYFYWYWDYICNSRCWALEKFRAIEFDRAQRDYHEAIERQNKLERENKHKKKGKPKDLCPVPTEPVAALASADEICMKAKSQLCRGQCRMHLAAAALGIGAAVKTEHKHTSWPLVFAKRFAALAAMHNPAFLSYEEYMATVMNVAGDSSALVEEANVSFNNVKKYMDFVRKSVGDGDKGTCFDDPPSAAKKQDIVGLLASAGLGAGASSVGLTAKSAADKIAKAYCVATLKVAVANSLGAVKTATTLKKREAVEEKAALTIVVDKSHNKHFPAIEIRPLAL